MADEEDPESPVQPEESDYEIPGMPDESRSAILNTSKTASKISKLQSLVSTIMQNGSPATSQVVPPLERTPSAVPSKTPSAVPSKTPSAVPSKTPSAVPSKTPSAVPSKTPSAVPSKTPSAVPSKTPSTAPSKQSTQEELLEEAESKSISEEQSKSQELSIKKSLDQLSKDTSQICQKPRLHRHCQRRFRELIGKREMKREELTKQQCVLKQRLDILECSMPAVMVWNIWRMSQGACVPNLKQVLEKQFQGPASGEVYCPSTPSRHFDCRVREVEAERKVAQKRVEEARVLWAEKEAALEEKSRRLEEARRNQVEIKENIENLRIEAQRLREAASKVPEDGVCEAGECRVIECKKKWLEKVPSGASIKSTDIECLEELQNLAQTELCMKRQIAELERREEAYMRTLQQADELWAKMQCDATSSMSALQGQLDVKTSANQQMADRIVQLEDVLEELRSRLAKCRSQLEKFMSIDKIEALIGRDDDFADVIERDILAKPEMDDAESEIRPDVDDFASGVQRSDLIAVGDAEQVISPEALEAEKQKMDEAMDYLASYGSLSELFVDDDYICAPDFICNDVVLTETGLTEEEMAALKEGRVTAEMLLKQMQEAGYAEEFSAADALIKHEHLEASVKEEALLDEEEREGLEDYEDADQITLESDRIEDEQISELKEAEEAEQEPSVDVEEFSIDVKEELSVDEEYSIDVEEELSGDAEEFSGDVEEEPSVDVKQEPSVDVSVVESDFVEQSIKTEPEDYLSAEEEDTTILIPLNELVTWQDNVDTIRGTIAKCPDCVVVKKGADTMAEEMSRYTGREVREVTEGVEEKPVAEAEIIAGEEVVEDIVSIREEVKEVEDVEETLAEAVSVTEAIPSVEDEAPLTELAPPSEIPPSEVAPVAEEKDYEKVEEDAESIAAIVEEKSITIEGIEAPPEVPAKETDVEVAEVSAPEDVQEDKIAPLVEAEREEIPGEEREVPKEKEVGETITEEAKEETESQILPEKDEVTAEKKEIEDDFLPEREEATPKEIAEVLVDEEGKEIPVEKEAIPEEEKIVVETAVKEGEEIVEAVEADLVETEEMPMDEEAVAEEKEEEAAVEAAPEKEEEEAVTEAAPEREEEEEAVTEAAPEEEEEAVMEAAPEEEKEEEAVMEAAPEEEAVMEPVPEEEEEEVPTEVAPEEEEKEPEEIVEEIVPEEAEPTEEGEEVPTDEVEKVVILSVEVLPEAEVEKEPEEEEIPEEVEEEELPVEVEEEEEIPVELEEELPEEVEVEILPEEEELEPEISELAVTIEVKVEEVCVLEKPVAPEVTVSEESVPGVCVCVPVEEPEEIPTPEETFGLPCVCSSTSKPGSEVSKVQEKVIEVPCVCCTMREAAAKEAKATTTEEICELPCTCFAMQQEPAPISQTTPEIRDAACDCSMQEQRVSQTVEEEVRSQKSGGSKASGSEARKLSSDRSYKPGTSKASGSEEVCKLPSDRSYKSGISKASGAEEVSKPPSVGTYKSGTSKASGAEEISKPPSVGTYKSGTSKASGAEQVSKPPSVSTYKSGTSKASGAEEVCKLPSVGTYKSGTSKASGSEETHKLPCVCSWIPEEHVLEEPGEHKPCLCSSKTEVPEAPEVPVPQESDVLPMYSIPVISGHPHLSTKMEITQTEFTTRTFETTQVVTQTVSDTGTQTPLNRLLRRTQNPKIIAVTGPVDTDMEILSQLSHRLKPMTQATLVTTTASSQTEKTAVYQSTSVSTKCSPSLRISEILQSLRAGVAQMKSGPEEELKTINYGRKSLDAAKCNCCICGKDIPGPVMDPRVRTSKQSSTVFRFQTPPKKDPIPSVDQGVQYDTICPKCKIIKLQESLRSRESLKQARQESTRSTCDRQVSASVSSFTPKGIPFSRLKKKIDQGVTAKIPRTCHREKPPKKKCEPEKQVQEIMPAKPEDKESVMQCMCEMETEETADRPRCACGDPD